MKLFLKILPWSILLFFASDPIAVMAPKKDGEFHLRDFGRLPVLMNGRIQPIDSVARNSLLQIRSTGDLPLELVPSWKFWHHPKKLKSSEWLAEVMFRPEMADERPVFLIHHPDLLSQLNLQDKGIEKSGLRYYTFNQIKPLLDTIWEQGTQAREIKDDQRTPLQKQVIKLQNAIFVYRSLQTAIHPPIWDDFADGLRDFEAAMPAGIAAFQAREAGKEYNEQDFNRFAEVAATAMKFKDDPNAGQFYPLVVPPENPDKTRDDWRNIWAALMDSMRDRQISPPVKYFASMATAFAQSNASQFNAALDDYKSWLGNKFAPELKKGRQEFFYNDTKAFLHALIIYGSAFVLALVSLLLFGTAPALSEALRRSALYLIVLAFIVHSFGLGFRMYLEGRPPVTNLYSSAIFIGWGAVVLGVILERFYRLGIGNIVASLVGLITLLIAHNLALGGDTMEMLRAVLDTNFWLATHVVVVTLGYASTFVAGLLAIIYIFMGVLTPMLSQKVTKGGTATVATKRPTDMSVGTALSKMAYAIICFATLFSFTGTVLGGIWADQSWGRFWGWDPKENGALIIVLWNATILHARWGGIVRERGIMNMAVIGNIVTSFSWFGVNLLGIGLHSYGFTDSGLFWLTLFVVSQLVVIGVGLLPKHLWRSFRSPAANPPPVPGTPAAAGA